MKETQEASRSRGIYLVANKQSAEQCNNLIYSIRRCGCHLPIRVIHFGGAPVPLDGRWDGVERVDLSDFPAQAVALLEELQRRMPQCNPGFLRRFLCWFGEFDEFLYSDNDVVALMNWEELFSYLDDYEVVHADEEFKTGGIFNTCQPARFEQLLGPGTLQSALTAGHFLCRRSPRHVPDLLRGLAWMEQHPQVVQWHDQTLLHVTVVLAGWPALNLCKPPHRWGSSWAGDYPNFLDVVRTVQAQHHPISHLHYSGGIATGANPVDDLLLSSLTVPQLNRKRLWTLLRHTSGWARLQVLARNGRHKMIRWAKRFP